MESSSSNAFATGKNGDFAIVAVAPWGVSGGGTLNPPEAGAAHGGRRWGTRGAVPEVAGPASFIMPPPPHQTCILLCVELLPWALGLCEIGLRRRAEQG